MAAIRSASTNTEVSSQSLVITAPTGAQASDVLVAFLTIDNNDHGVSTPYTGAIAASSGAWTTGPIWDQAHVLAAFHMELAGAPDASYTFTTTASAGPFKGTIICVNPDGDTFVGFGTPAYNNNTGGTAISTAAMTAVGDPSVLLCGFSHDGGGTVSSAPSGMTQQGLSTGDSCSIAAYSEVNPTDSPTITRSITWSSTEQLLAIAYVLEFSAGGGGSFTLTAETDAFDITGTDATLTYVAPIDAFAGVFPITGMDATLTYITNAPVVSPGRASVSISMGL